MASKDALTVTAPLVKTIIFAIVGTLILGVLWVQFGLVRFNEQKTYTAVFSSSSGILEASTVTASGVDIGRVDKIEVTEDSLARVTITVDATAPVSTNSIATIKFKNLTGDQYLDLAPGPGNGQPLADGGEIPLAQTRPSLDIDALLNGFNPLLQGLQPEQVNQLSAELVTVLQGQGGTLNSVLAHAASFTGSLADQDKVIGSVITNLNTVLAGVDQHSGELSETVLHAQRLVSQLAGHRQQVLDRFQRSGELAEEVGDLARALNDEPRFFPELGRAMSRFTQEPEEFSRILGLLPGAYLRLGRVATNGSGYDFGLCSIRLRLTGPDGRPYYTPQIGPSDNNRGCSNQDVAPLQGQGPTPHEGPGTAEMRSDGQAVAEDANEGGYVEKHDKNPGNPETGSN